MSSLEFQDLMTDTGPGGGFLVPTSCFLLPPIGSADELFLFFLERPATRIVMHKPALDKSAVDGALGAFCA